MDLERNKAVVRELDALSNGEGDIGRLDELCTPDIMNHTLGPNGRRGIEATREFLKKPRRGRWVHSHVIAEGDWVVQFGSREFEWGGGPFRGFEAPAGTCARDVAFAYRLVDGRIAERWAVRDDLTMLLQLGDEGPQAAGYSSGVWTIEPGRTSVSSHTSTRSACARRHTCSGQSPSKNGRASTTEHEHVS